MRTGMVLDALEMARWSRGTQLEGLRCHSDAGSRSSRASVTANDSPRSARSRRSASVGDSYDNALAETVNGLYKTELIRGPGHVDVNRPGLLGDSWLWKPGGVDGDRSHSWQADDTAVFA